MKLADLKDVAVIAAVIYIVYLLSKAKGKTEETYNEAVQTASDWLSAMFGPNLLDPIQFSPYTKPDGSRGSRVTRVVRLSDGQQFIVDYSGSSPKLVAV